MKEHLITIQPKYFDVALDLLKQHGVSFQRLIFSYQQCFIKTDSDRVKELLEERFLHTPNAIKINTQQRNNKQVF